MVGVVNQLQVYFYDFHRSPFLQFMAGPFLALIPYTKQFFKSFNLLRQKTIFKSSAGFIKQLNEFDREIFRGARNDGRSFSRGQARCNVISPPNNLPRLHHLQ